jgi:hypothetical protein
MTNLPCMFLAKQRQKKVIGGRLQKSCQRRICKSMLGESKVCVMGLNRNTRDKKCYEFEPINLKGLENYSVVSQGFVS